MGSQTACGGTWCSESIPINSSWWWKCSIVSKSNDRPRSGIETEELTMAPAISRATVNTRHNKVFIVPAFYFLSPSLSPTPIFNHRKYTRPLHSTRCFQQELYTKATPYFIWVIFFTLLFRTFMWKQFINLR